MRLHQKCLAAVCAGLAAVTVAATAAAARKDAPPVAAVGNLFDPAEADRVAFAPDGGFVAIENSRWSPSVMTLWDAASGRLLRGLASRTFVNARLFARNGSELVTGHRDGQIKFWDTRTGRLLDTVRQKPRRGGEKDDAVETLWLDPRGELLVVGAHQGSANIWSLARHRLVLAVELPATDKLGNTMHIIDARLTASGERLRLIGREPGGVDGVAEFDARSGAKLAAFILPNGTAFADNGVLSEENAVVVVTGSACPRGELKLFSFRERGPVADIYKPDDCAMPADRRQAEEPRIFVDNTAARIVVADGKAAARVWNVATRRPERTLAWPDSVGMPLLMGVSGDLRLAAVREDGRVRIRAIETGAITGELRGFVADAAFAAASLDGRHILLQRDRPEDAPAPAVLDLRALDAAAPTTFRLALDATFTVLDVLPQAKLAVAGSDNGELRLVALDGADPRKVDVASTLKSIDRARLSPDGKLVLVLGEPGGDAETSRSIAALLSLSDGQVRKTFVGHGEDDSVTAVAVSPDGRTIAIGHHDGTAEIWDTASLKGPKLLPAPGADNDVRVITFSADGRSLIAGGMFDDAIWLWDVASGGIVRRFDLGASVAGYRYATALALSHDGRTLVAGLGQRHQSSGDKGAESGALVAWDATSGKRLFVTREQYGAIPALAFSADDRWIVSASRDGTVQYTDRAGGKLMATAAAMSAGGWLVLTEAGFYAAADGADKAVSLVRGLTAVPVARARDALARPDLVAELLKGDTAGRYRDAARKLDLSAVMERAARRP